MQFTETVSGETYTFYFINATTVLVTGAKNEYILYKSKKWMCADDIASELLKGLSDAIDHRKMVSPLS
jgi:hypothetical protein